MFACNGTYERRPMAKRKLLNVKSLLEAVIETTEYMQKYNYKDGPTGLCMPPIYIEAMIQHKLIAKAILRKHEEKKTRKDVYI
jgi:hypothetical protein